MAYSYDPNNITELTKDRMRFELGDTMIGGGADTSALADEEIEAILSMYPKKKDWKRAKLMLLQNICMKFAYEPDTKIGPLQYGLHERAKLWKQMYDELKSELTIMTVPKSQLGKQKPPYFYTGMMKNPNAGGD